MSMTILIPALVIAAAVAFLGWRIGRELRAMREDAVRGRRLALIQLFAEGQSAAHADPRALLIWQPMANGRCQ